MAANSYKVQIKHLLGLTNFDACCSLPAKDCNSCIVTDFLLMNSWRSLSRSHLFLSGSWKIILSVSNTIPKNSKMVEGP